MLCNIYKLPSSLSSLLYIRQAFSRTPSASPFHRFVPFRMASTLPRLPIFSAIASHDPKSLAVVHSDSGRSFTYGDLARDVSNTKAKLLAASKKDHIHGERVAFLIENGYDYVGALRPFNPNPSCYSLT